MKKTRSFLLAVASVVSTLNFTAVAADRVVQYEPGAGYSPRFTNPEVVLGEPSGVNPYGEATDPFNPAYGTNQIVSIGAGGYLTIRLQKPILNHPRNLYGLDFTIYGNSGFIITNEYDLVNFDWVGTPATDGSLFGSSGGATRVSVSHNGKHFYALNPDLAPGVDVFPPTDGAGDIHVPVPPSLSSEDLAGATLDDIRALYRGSAGGASFDINWAIDDQGQSVWLPMVRYIRIEVLEGKAEIDAISSVARVPRRVKGKDVKVNDQKD